MRDAKFYDNLVLTWFHPSTWWSKADRWYLNRDMDQDRREANLANIRQADHAFYCTPKVHGLSLRQQIALKGLLRAFWLS